MVSLKTIPRIPPTIKKKSKLVKKLIQQKGQMDEKSEESDETTMDNESDKMKLVIQELKFAKILAGNDPKLSTKQLKQFRRWLKIRSNSSFAFTDADFLRIWKGLFYFMWMSDKPLVQEKCAEDLASLLQCFDDELVAIRFFGMFLSTMNKEWSGVDQWRIDKFMMLVRRMTRQMLQKLQNVSDQKRAFQHLADQIETIVLNPNVTVGFFMHFVELILEEMAKIGNGETFESVVVDLVRPFATYVAKSKNPRLTKHVIRHVFYHLLYQTEMGREYQEKFDAWKSLGFPGTSIDELELVANDPSADAVDDDEMIDDENDEDNEAGEQHFDPRAGRIDVIMPELKFRTNDIIEIFNELLTKEYTTVKTRKALKKLLKQYTTFAQGEFPLGIKRMEINAKNFRMPKIEDKVNEFIQFERKLLGKTKELKRLNKKKRKQAIKSNIEITKSKPIEADELQQKLKTLKKPKRLTKKQKLQINSWQEDDIDVSLLSKSNDSLLETSNGDDVEMDQFEGNTITTTTTVVASTPDRKKTPSTASAKKDLVINPVAILGKKKLAQKMLLSAPTTPIARANEKKKVKIMLKLNRSQDTNEYIQQIRSSPNVPYDSTKKPAKSLLKPNLLPSPINPYYRKKIGLDL